MGPLVQRAGRLRARTDGDEHPPLEQRLPEGGTGKESDGAVGGGQRRLRGDAGVDGGLGALPEEEEYGVWELARDYGYFARDIAGDYGTFRAGDCTGTRTGDCTGFREKDVVGFAIAFYFSRLFFARVLSRWM